MTPKEKPEWFEISENDKSSNVRPISKRIPILALVATALILGVGAVIAQTQEESPASANEASTASPTVSEPNQVVAEQPTPAINKPKITAPSIKAPKIAKPPINRGDDDEFGERGERGERHGFGDDD